MPIYEYRCEECHQVFEEWQNNFEERKVPCPVCGGNSERMISHSAFILKGSGWYVTDYSRKGTSAEGNGNGNGKNGQKKDAAAADSSGDKKSADQSAKPGADANSGSQNKSSSTQADTSQ